MRLDSLLSMALAAAAVALATAPAQAVSIDLVTVGNAGNAPSPLTQYGAVAYSYEIAKYDVTNTQYAAMLNAVAATDTYALYVDAMGSLAGGGITRSGYPGSYTYAVKPRYENMPVVFVNWYSALRFCNWLTNGQPTGTENPTTTEAGAYTLTGATSVDPLPDHASLTGSRWLLPTANEWYKAAYHKNDGPTGNYYNYATSSDIGPVSAPPSNAPNTANIFAYVGIDNDVARAVSGYNGTDLNNYLSDVGAYAASASPYGTSDQNGNVWQWIEEEVEQPPILPSRGLRGGSWNSTADDLLLAGVYGERAPVIGSDDAGFRVAYEPEPGSITLLLAAAIALLVFRRRWNR